MRSTPIGHRHGGDYVAGHRQVTRHIPAANGRRFLAGSRRRVACRRSSASIVVTTRRVHAMAGRRRSARRALEAVGIPVYENDVQRPEQ